MDPPVCPLGQRETERYSRQLLVPSVGVIGHSRIEACSVLVVGAGGLGSPCALYLAGAGTFQNPGTSE
jgi:molybdopterin/thiamine biosynthesis adenylyltransferase